MEALESQLGSAGSGDKRKTRDRELDEEFDSMFRTKVNQEHLMG
jgi:hypothetical protein